MTVEQERHTAVRAHRLERRTAAKQRLVIGAEDGLLRIDEASAPTLRLRGGSNRDPAADRREERPRLDP